MKSILPIFALAVEFALAICVAVIAVLAVSFLEEKRDQDSL